MSKNPSVVVVGRMNVGKSTLFNRLSVSIKSLTLDYAGVTRDFIRDSVCWKNRCFDLVDTGGINLSKTQDILQEKTRQIALEMLEKADVALFVVDGATGLVKEDRDIAKILHKFKKNVIVAANKMDRKEAQEVVHEFRQLGFQTIIPVSAEHARGIGDILDAITDLLPEKVIEDDKKPGCRIVLIGKPNVGKSSLLNLLLKKDRSMVSEIPGTTREAISETISFYQEDILVTDTPGIRKKKSVTEDLETMMVKSSMRALDNADIVLLLVDASEGKVADQELKLAFYAFTQKYKGLIILFNKQDLVTERSKEDMKFNLEEYEYMLNRVPQLSISCKTERNTGKIIPLVMEVCQRYYRTFTENELTTLFKNELEKKPLYHKTVPLILFGVEQIKRGPITIALRVNDPNFFGPSQLTFFENLMRKTYDLKGVPIKFVTRRRR